jgi:hypothetical protein
VKKGGARLLGRPAVRPFYNIIIDLKIRLHSAWQQPNGADWREMIPLDFLSKENRRGPMIRGGFEQKRVGLGHLPA